MGSRCSLGEVRRREEGDAGSLPCFLQGDGFIQFTELPARYREGTGGRGVGPRGELGQREGSGKEKMGVRTARSPTAPCTPLFPKQRRRGGS